MGYARVAFPPELLIAALRLPASTRIIGADMTHSHGEVVLTLEHADLQDMPRVDGAREPVTTPIFNTVSRTDVTFIGWGQG
jgi:hypothetical protein